MKSLEFVDPNRYFDEIRRYKNAILFGCGSKGRQALPILAEHGIQITAACDNNPELLGEKFLPGIEIQSLEDAVQSVESCCIIITTAIVSAVEIYEQIKNEFPGIPLFHLCAPFKVESGLLSARDFEAHREDIQYTYELLQDEESRRIYCDNINWKLTGNFIASAGTHTLYTALPVYSFFDDQLVHTDSSSVYVDVGAYTGDSVESFLIFSRGRFKKVIAVEADSGNYSALNQFVQYSRIEQIETHHQALWSTVEDKIFYTNSDNHNIHFDSPNLFRSVDKIADNKKLEQMSGKLTERVVRTNTLDGLLLNERPSIIKINALSADRHIILGGTETLRKYKPTLILEYGVNKEDVFEMLNTIRSANSNYHFYMRRKRVFGDVKTILYCK